jgi:antitoxin component YwqK of YwqJK toxin-antitoxin module
MQYPAGDNMQQNDMFIARLRSVVSPSKNDTTRKYLFYCNGKKVFEEECDAGGQVIRQKGKLPERKSIMICDEKGTRLRETAYFKGKEEGPCRIYSDFNGRAGLSMEVVYHNGKKNGKAKIFDAEGTIQQEVTYAADIKNGLFNEFYTNGRLKNTGEYKEDRQEGLWKEYSDQGMIREEKTYHHGILDGQSLFYTAAGTLAEAVTYSNGFCVRRITYTADGKLLTDVSYARNPDGGITTDYKTFDAKGNLQSEKQY